MRHCADAAGAVDPCSYIGGVMTRDGREQTIINEQAFAIWEEEGRPEGKSVVHWLRAEAEIIGVTDNGKRLKSATPGLLSRVAAARGALRPADARRAGSQSWRDTAVYRSILEKSRHCRVQPGGAFYFL